MILVTLMLIMGITMAIGIPIAWTLGISGVVSLIMMGIPLSTLPAKIFGGINIFPLLCVPLFILAGEIMAYGGFTHRLLRFAVIIIGFIRGGLALANVVASMLFGGITGAAVADASALGSVEIPMMKESGYDASFSAAITAASACIGPIIPPSIPVIIYAMAVSGTSVGGLFAAGMIPGILVGLALMVASYIISVKRKYPKREEKITFKDFLHSFKDAFLAIMTPVIILGGILGGVCTPTEAASIAVVYTFIISYFVFRELKLKDLPKMFLAAGVGSALVMIIIGTSTVFGMVVAFEQVAMKLEVLLRPLGYFGFLLAINVIFLFVGTFMDNNPAIIILAPVFAPIAVALGIEPLHFGIIVVMNLVIGLITPPLGLVLFVVGPIAKVTFEQVTKEVLPFLFVEIAVLLMVTYIPSISLVVPRWLGYCQ